MTKRLTVLTFNLLFGRALEELVNLAKEHKPDVICSQEFPVNEQTVKQLEAVGYILADYSPSFFKHFRFYSLATFYNPQTIKHQNGQTISLSRGLYELLLFFLRFSPQARTSLNNNFIHKASKHKFRICNIHLTALQSGNKVRVKQLQTILSFLRNNGQNKPTVVMGDFNYVYKRKTFEQIFQRYGFKEATNNLFYTFELTILGFFKVKMKPDYIWYQHLHKCQTLRFKRRFSDHFPILAKFSF